jgi:hypothetical protein
MGNVDYGVDVNLGVFERHDERPIGRSEIVDDLHQRLFVSPYNLDKV